MDLLQQLFGLGGRTVVVTGGASGLGRRSRAASPASGRPS